MMTTQQCALAFAFILALTLTHALSTQTAPTWDNNTTMCPHHHLSHQSSLPVTTQLSQAESPHQVNQDDEWQLPEPSSPTPQYPPHLLSRIAQLSLKLAPMGHLGIQFTNPGHFTHHLAAYTIHPHGTLVLGMEAVDGLVMGLTTLILSSIDCVILGLHHNTHCGGKMQVCLPSSAGMDPSNVSIEEEDLDVIADHYAVQSFRWHVTWHVIITTSIEIDFAIKALRLGHAELVKHLEAAVEQLGSWKADTFKEILDDLAKICCYKDVPTLALYETSAIKGNNFAVCLMQPLFFSSPNFTFQQWGEAMVFSHISGKPTPQVPASLLKIVISDKYKMDHNRMLVQATALQKFFLMVIYLDADMIVSQYVVMEAEGGDDDHECKLISIHQKDFDLQRANDQVDLLQEMYNLAACLDLLSGELDPIKKGQLLSIYQAVTKVVSLSSKEKTKTSHQTTMPPIDEELRELHVQYGSGDCYIITIAH
ncbi:hypothetical protein OG21DRAFT_1525621 [Imleria badia]|nr:hypothetical protein OG21DRAFT_1525621 [Imleria badia]